MGTYNYMVIPAMQIKIVTKIDTNTEYHTPDIRAWDKLFDNPDITDLEDITDVKVNDLTINQLNTLINAKKIIEGVTDGDMYYYEELLCYYLTKKGIDYFTINENNEKQMKKYENYKTIDII